MEEMLTMDPLPFSTIPLEKAWVTRKVLMKLRSKTWRNPAGSRSKNDCVAAPDDLAGAWNSSEVVPLGLLPPAPLIKKSGAPHNLKIVS